MRVGVVTDTHVGEYLESLPAALVAALDSCDHIIHAGDISRAWVLDELRAIAPVTAVQGDHDTFGDIALPRSAVLTVEGVRIGVTHGRRWYPLEVAVTLATVLSNGLLRWNGGLDRSGGRLDLRSLARAGASHQGAYARLLPRRRLPVGQHAGRPHRSTRPDGPRRPHGPSIPCAAGPIGHATSGRNPGDLRGSSHRHPRDARLNRTRPAAHRRRRGSRRVSGGPMDPTRVRRLPQSTR